VGHNVATSGSRCMTRFASDAERRSQSRDVTGPLAYTVRRLSLDGSSKPRFEEGSTGQVACAVAGEVGAVTQSNAR
jgi:hypothetical protein